MIGTVRQHLRRSSHTPLHFEASLALFAAGLAITSGKDGKDRPGRDMRMVAAGLMLLGGLGVMTLLLRPLMYALQLLPLAFGAAACMLCGLAWIGFGLALGTGTRNA